MTLLIFTHRFQSKKPLISLSRSCRMMLISKIERNSTLMISKHVLNFVCPNAIFSGKTYLLNNSAPIGLALIVVIAETYLQYHEKNAIHAALRENSPVAPKSFVRYVDDNHAQNLDSTTGYQRILNQQDPVNIKYTMDTEDNKKSL